MGLWVKVDVQDNVSYTYIFWGPDGSLPITKATGETTDMSEYLDFGFYNWIWYRDNAVLGHIYPGRWQGASETHGILRCYWILNKNIQVVSRPRVQWVTPLELQTTDHSSTFSRNEAKIKLKLSEKDQTYYGNKKHQSILPVPFSSEYLPSVAVFTNFQHVALKEPHNNIYLLYLNPRLPLLKVLP